jgi:hypothetical protein
MIQPITNPIRFYSSSLVPDWQYIFPNFSNQLIGTQYYEAFKPLPFMREHIVGDIKFQLQYEGMEELPSMDCYRNGVLVFSVDTNVFLDDYRLITATLSEGVWKFVFGGWTSDYIFVKEANNRIIKVEAWNDSNVFNTYFGKLVDNVWQQLYQIEAYYSGFITPKIGTTYIDQYKGDPNTVVNVEIEPSFNWTVYLEVHQSYLKHILYLFSLNNININDKIVTLKGEIKDSLIADTDIIGITAEFQLVNTYNYD